VQAQELVFADPRHAVALVTHRPTIRRAERERDAAAPDDG
jgi:hypothetical protein